MKKIILLPLMVLPLLTGCNLKQPKFSLEDWLTDIKEGTPTFFDMYNVKNEDGTNHPGNCFSDYGYKLAGIIMENSANKSLNMLSPGSNKPHIRYSISREMGDFYRVQILIFENAIMMNAEGYDKNNEYITESTNYSIPKEDSKKIMDEAIKWWDEMDELADETHYAVYEEMGQENFCNYIENLDTAPSVIRYKKEKKDTDFSLLDDIKDFVMIEKDDDYLFLNDGVVTYGIEDDYVMEIGRDPSNKLPVAQLVKYYHNPALLMDYDELIECRVAYSISEEKLINFLNKVQAM